MSNTPTLQATFSATAQLTITITYPKSGQVTRYLVPAEGWRLLGYRAWQRRAQGKPGGAGWIIRKLQISACPRRTLVQGTTAAERHARDLTEDPGPALSVETVIPRRVTVRPRLPSPPPFDDYDEPIKIDGRITTLRIEHSQRYESEVEP